jgi:hypothetical protein
VGLLWLRSLQLAEQKTAKTCFPVVINKRKQTEVKAESWKGLQIDRHADKYSNPYCSAAISQIRISIGSRENSGGFISICVCSWVDFEAVTIFLTISFKQQIKGSKSCQCGDKKLSDY